MTDRFARGARLGNTADAKLMRVRLWRQGETDKASRAEMKAAPQEAFYVWPRSSAKENGERLAAEAGRPDLRIVHPGWLLYPREGAVMFDPGTRLSRRQRESWRQFVQKRESSR